MASFLTIEKLLGRENYSTWKFAMKALLELEDLWEVIENNGEEGKTKVNSKKDIKAKSRIVLSVDAVNYSHINNAKTAREAWKNLESAFEDSGLKGKKEAPKMNHVNYATCCRVVTYNCNSCKIPFKTVTDFKNHMKQKHILFVCHCCSYKTDKYQNLEQHNRDKHCKYEGLLHCPFCHFLNNEWNQIEAHIITAHLCLQFGYYCSNCGFKTTDQNLIKNHLKINHNTDLKFCFCSLDPELANAYNNKQITSFTFNCSFCNCNKDKYQCLLQHFKDAHWIDFDDDDEFNDRPFCLICNDGIAYVGIHEMNQHLSRHDTEVKCNFCTHFLQKTSS